MSLADELLNEPMGRPSEQVPATPYTLARAHWDDRLGTLVTNAKHWRLGFFAVLFACLSLIGGLIYGGLFALANFVNPKPREMTIVIPPDKFQKKDER